MGISPDNYTLFAYARRLYSGHTDLPTDELSDSYTVSDEAFRFAVNAVVIARHGPEVLRIKNKDNQDKLEEQQNGSIPN